ncbi:MAG: aminotransferase class V-fold PLP-dependent enzyme [Clostridia bacterium]|nr:aminotransferase class V-fold PLP-dependent enzyme [Clostridia bacterium]
MIYLDNAATTLIKPYSVIEACNLWLNKFSANPGRGGHKLSLNAGNKVYECRELIAKLFNIDKPENIVFTLNTTMALNIAINGFVKPGIHIVISGMEHNSVFRPVSNCGCSFSIAEPDPTGFVSVESIKKVIRPNTSMIIITHASNVVGTVNPITEIGAFAKSKGITFLVDAAQSAGVLDIDVKRDNIDMLAFAGHKSLLGPTGTGGLYISPDINLTPSFYGGTGSVSESSEQPDFLPDRFESGTLNIVGIAGLTEGVRYILKNTPKTIREYEQRLTEKLLEGLYNMDNITLYGGTNRVGIVSFSANNMDSVSFCNMLDYKNIAARGGLHCSPLAHKYLNTTDGLVRLSVSCFNTYSDINAAIDAVYKISNKK